MHRYRAFGLSIASDAELPELLPDEDGAGGADVVVRLAPVPDALDDPAAGGVLYQASPGCLRLEVPGVASYLITSGSEIRVRPTGDVLDKDARLFLYGSAMGAVLQQRGDLTLHASAVTDGERVLLFAGPSGHGKSTLAAAFAAHGYGLVSDDLVTVRRRSDGSLFSPAGFPWIKLWADALTRLDIDDTPLARVREGLQKSYLPVPPTPASVEAPISHVFVLHPHNEDGFAARRITGMAKLAVLERNTYRRQFLEGLGGKAAHFQGCHDLAASAAVITITRPRVGFRVDELRDLVLDLVAAERVGLSGVH